MSKIMPFMLGLFLFLALVSFFLGVSFDFRDYFENLSNLPDKPDLPKFDGDGLDIIKDIGKAIIYPFEFIIYVGKAVYVISGGLQV